MRRLICVAAACVLAMTVLAQVRETVNVNVIEVPVTVVDSSGNPIRGLTVDNFELYDNGTKRQVTSFDKIDFASTESVSAISPLNPAGRRNFMLLFDLSNSSPNSLARAQTAARNFVSNTVKPRDLIAVGNIEAEKGFHLLTAFTTDRQLVASAIADPAAFRGSDPLQIAAHVASVTPQEEPTTTDTGSRTGTDNKAMAAENQKEMAAMAVKQNQGFIRQRVERNVDALGQLAKTLRAVPGHKQVVLLSEGFDATVLQGRDVRATQEAQQENEQALHGQAYMIDSDARFGNTSSMTVLDRMAQYFRQSDVVLHAIDIQGLRVQNDVQSGATINSNAGLFLLARSTGGDVFQNANTIKTDFDRMLKAQEVVYVLSFQAPTQKAGTFHNLKVKLVNVPGGRASYRAGYYEAGGETPTERTLSNAEIIVNDIPQTDVHLTAFSAAFQTKTVNAQVPVILEINGADLLNGVRGDKANVEIYIYAFDDQGVARDRLYQKVSVDLKKTDTTGHALGEKMKATGIKYWGTLSLPPGNYAVKSLVRSLDNDKRGFGRADIVVAKANDLAVLPPIPIDENTKWVLVKGNSHDPSGANPFSLNGQQFIPTTVARKNGGAQKVAVFVYGATADELQWETNPKTKFLGRADGGGATALVLELDPADAGVASLDVTVKKKGGTATQKSSVAIVQ